MKIFSRLKKEVQPIESEDPDCTGSKNGFGDYEQWLICKKKGHIAVNSMDDWLCLRCWTGYFIGMRYPIKDTDREAFKKGGLTEGSYIIAVSPKDTLFSSEGSLVYARVHHNGKCPFEKGMKIISYDEAIVRGENTEAPDKGGPPYVYEVKRMS